MPKAEGGGLRFDVVVEDATTARNRDLTWLPAGLLAAVLLLTMTATSFGGTKISGSEDSGSGKLQWRAAGSKTTKNAAKRALYHASRGRVSGARFVDPSVKTVQYQAPSSRQESSGRVGGFRVAQGTDGPDFGDELKRRFEQPLFDEEKSPAPPEVDGGEAFEELPPQSNETDDYKADLTPLDFDEPKSPARPKFDPFDEPENEAKPGSGTKSGSDTKPGSGAKPQGGASGSSSKALSKSETERQRKEREKATEDCAKELASLRSSNLTMVDIKIGRTGVEGEDFPYICSIDDGVPLSPRSWAPITYTWKASALCHKPLYFEQEQVERYGHSWGPVLQPFVSGAHFFGHLTVLPYSMGLKTPNECVYALGHYRPGSCAPYLIPAVPFTWRAALFQTGFATGAAFAIP